MASPGHDATGIVKVATPNREAEMNRILIARRVREPHCLINNDTEAREGFGRGSRELRQKDDTERMEA